MTIDQAKARIAELERELIPLIAEEQRLWSEQQRANQIWVDYSSNVVDAKRDELNKLKAFLEIAQ